MKNLIKVLAIIVCLSTFIASLIIVIPLLFSEEFGLTQKMVAIISMLVLNISLIYLSKEAINYE